MTTTKETAMSGSTLAWVELADRQGDGLDVRLLWNRADGSVKVTVRHLATERLAELDADPQDALTAFHHPFAYRRAGLDRRRTEVAKALA
jgi:hypothetical protein